VKKIVNLLLGVVTSVGGFVEVGSISTAAQAGSEFGFALLWDLRLLNVTLRRVPVSDVQARVMPWTNVGFVIMAIRGALLFYEEPVRFYGNIFFRLKLIALVLAGLNAAIFHFFTAGKRLIEWDSSPVSPPSAKAAGYVSLFLWACIVVFGRFIAYNWFDPIVQ